MKTYPLVVTVAIRGLKALDMALPTDLVAHAREFGIDPSGVTAYPISEESVRAANAVYRDLFDHDARYALAVYDEMHSDAVNN